MRALLATIFNLIRLVLAVLAWPFRLLASRRRPKYVRFLLEGDPPYRKTKRRRLFAKRPEPGAVTSIEQLRAQLELLAADPRIDGALFELEGLHVTPAKRLAIEALVADFRRNGKEAVGYAVSAGNGEYPLLCAMDRVLLPSAGRIDVTGYAAEATAAGAALKRLGVGAHFIRRGEYKTAPEVFTEQTISPAARRVTEELLQERYEHLVAAMATGRRMTPEQARSKIDAGPYSARRAIAEGLADGIVAEADLAELLEKGEVKAPLFERRREPPQPAAKKKPDEKKPARKPRLVSYAGYERTLPWAPHWTAPRLPKRLGLVKVEGMIVSGEASRGIGQLAASKTVAKALRAAARDERSKAVLLYVNSGGGSAVASELILEEVHRLQHKKPVVAYFDRVAASGGYMVMLGADEVWGGPLSIVGSIGVFAGKFELSELFARVGVKREVIAFGENAGLASTARGFTDSERRSLDAEIDETYEAFLQLVGQARGLSRDEVHRRGEGRVYGADAAMEAKLIDRIGSFEDACRRALELAGERPPTFELHPFSSARRGLGALAALQSAARAQVWAWAPELAIPADLAGAGKGDLP